MGYIRMIFILLALATGSSCSKVPDESRVIRIVFDNELRNRYCGKGGTIGLSSLLNSMDIELLKILSEQDELEGENIEVPQENQSYILIDLAKECGLVLDAKAGIQVEMDISLSKCYFTDKGKAIVYFEINKDLGEASGHFVILEKQEGNWVILVTRLYMVT